MKDTTFNMDSMDNHTMIWQFLIMKLDHMELPLMLDTMNLATHLIMEYMVQTITNGKPSLDTLLQNISVMDTNSALDMMVISNTDKLWLVNIILDL